jgi:hypothetical protein
MITTGATDFDIATLQARRTNKWHKFPPHVLPAWVADMEGSPRPPATRWRVTPALRWAGRNGRPRCFGEPIRDACTNTNRRSFLDPELGGDRVGGLETDAADIACEAIGIVSHDLDGIGAIGLIDPNGARRADLVAMQRDHDLAHDLLLRPGQCDAARANRPNAINLAQTIWLSWWTIA